MQIPIQFTSNQKILAGMLHVPKSRLNNNPTVIICYGLDGTRTELHRQFLFFSNIAEEMGITVLRFDYAGLGVSEGDFWDVTIDTKAEDVITAITYIDNIYKGDKYEISLLGISDGAKVAVKVANQVKTIKNIILCSPLLYSENHNNNININVTKFAIEQRTKKVVYPFYGLWMNPLYLKQIMNENYLEAFISLGIPTLCTFGEKDKMNKSLQNEIKRISHIESIFIKNADHIYSRSSWAEEVNKKMLGWILSKESLVK